MGGDPRIALWESIPSNFSGVIPGSPSESLGWWPDDFFNEFSEFCVSRGFWLSGSGYRSGVIPEVILRIPSAFLPMLYYFRCFFIILICFRNLCFRISNCWFSDLGFSCLRLLRFRIFGIYIYICIYLFIYLFFLRGGGPIA